MKEPINVIPQTASCEPSFFVRLANWLGFSSETSVQTNLCVEGVQPSDVPPAFAQPAPASVCKPQDPCLQSSTSNLNSTESTDTNGEELEELYRDTLQYKNSAAYRELLNYIARFRNYSSYNLFLIKVQKPDARYVATTKHWLQCFGRRLKPDSKPLIILRPGGPVMFVYDLPDTDGREAPKSLLDPFHVEGAVAQLVWKTVLKNCYREGFAIIEQKLPKTHAGSVSGRIGADSKPPYFHITLNAEHEETVRFVTLVHELAHIYCGHLGGHPTKRWPDRSRLPLQSREFEAESVAYLVAKRRKIESGSERYLSEYLSQHTIIPQINIELVVKVADRIETMGHALKPEKKIKVK